MIKYKKINTTDVVRGERMLGLNDFKKDGKAYILERNMGYNKPPEIHETTVTNIGRKYVHVLSFNRKYKCSDVSDGMIEEVKFGSPTELYATREQAEYQIEHQSMLREIRYNMRFLNKCTLEELQKINALLCNHSGLE